jgi:hypothetical protein
MERNLAGFFQHGAALIFGGRARNKAFREQVEIAVRKAPWVVHWIVPLRMGGTTRPTNMSIMLADQSSLMLDEIDIQLSKRENFIRIRKPLYPVFLPRSDSQLRLPIVNDEHKLIELALPLDQYSREALKKLGLRKLGRCLAETNKIKLLNSADDSFEECGAAIEKPNRKHSEVRKLEKKVRPKQKKKPALPAATETKITEVIQTRERPHDKAVALPNTVAIEKKRVKKNRPLPAPLEEQVDIPRAGEIEAKTVRPKITAGTLVLTAKKAVSAEPGIPKEERWRLAKERREQEKAKNIAQSEASLQKHYATPLGLRKEYFRLQFVLEILKQAATNAEEIAQSSIKTAMTKASAAAKLGEEIKQDQRAERAALRQEKWLKCAENILTRKRAVAEKAADFATRLQKHNAKAARKSERTAQNAWKAVEKLAAEISVRKQNYTPYILTNTKQEWRLAAKKELERKSSKAAAAALSAVKTQINAEEAKKRAIEAAQALTRHKDKHKEKLGVPIKNLDIRQMLAIQKMAAESVARAQTKIATISRITPLPAEVKACLPFSSSRRRRPQDTRARQPEAAPRKPWWAKRANNQPRADS